jgi:hypothetical protein
MQKNYYSDPVLCLYVLVLEKLNRVWGYYVWGNSVVSAFAYSSVRFSAGRLVGRIAELQH